MKLFLKLLLVAAALLSGCSPRIIERVQRDTLWRERVQVDSIYKRDSVYIREKGDTIYIYKERIRDRYILRRDTLVRVVRDSVAVERIKEVKIEKPLSWAQRLKIRAFWWLFGALALLLLWVFRKPLLKLMNVPFS